MRTSPLAASALAALILLSCRNGEPHAGDTARASAGTSVTFSAPPAASPASATPPGDDAARCTAVFPEGFPCPEGAHDAFDSPEGGRTLAIFTLDAPLDGAYRAWVAALGRRGFTIGNEYAEAGGRAATACRDGCAKETFHFGLSVETHGLRGHVQVFPPVRSGPLPALPGACEPIPEHRFRVRRDDVTWTFATVRMIDLDRDGVLDAMVPSPGAGGCPGTVAWDLYVVRGACGHHVGRVEGQMPEVHGVGPGGFVDLTDTYSHDGEMDFRTYRFDGAAYTVLETQHRARHPMAHGEPPHIELCRMDPIEP